GSYSQSGHQVEVLLELVIVVCRDRSVAAVGDHARPARETVPDALAPATCRGCPFDLKRRRRHAPREVSWEVAHGSCPNIRTRFYREAGPRPGRARARARGGVAWRSMPPGQDSAAPLPPRPVLAA